jgi:hypothetical protein
VCVVLGVGGSRGWAGWLAGGRVSLRRESCEKLLQERGGAAVLES